MARPKKDPGGVRLHLELSEAVHERLLALRERTDAASLSEVVRRALATYELIVDRTKGGDRVVVRTSSGEDLALIVV
jgi:hypothetical protein